MDSKILDWGPEISVLTALPGDAEAWEPLGYLKQTLT